MTLTQKIDNDHVLLMKISKTHQMFSEDLKDPRALTNPEDYLGPNWRDVINFWLYIDGLTEEEMDKMNNRYCSLSEDVLDSAHLSAQSSAEEVVGQHVEDVAWSAAWDVTDWGSVFAYATEELLAHHKLLEQDKTLVALPLCINQ
jgi:hypothetical protein